MPKLKLTYFDVHGGRGETARLALHIGGIPFEDERFGFADFPSVRLGTPFKAVPVLWVDGEPVSQSTAINRYVGKLAGLYPSEPLAALHCDEVLDGVEDVIAKLVASFGLSGDELIAARTKFVEGPLPIFLKGFEQILAKRGPDYFVGNQFSVADLCVFVWVNGLKSGMLDHVPTTIVDELAPGLAAHHQRIKNRDEVVGYYQQFNPDPA